MLSEEHLKFLLDGAQSDAGKKASNALLDKIFAWRSDNITWNGKAWTVDANDLLHFLAEQRIK